MANMEVLLGTVLDDSRIAYLVADHNLLVIATGGHIAVLEESQCSDSDLKHLTEVAPEWIGSEDALIDVVSGRLHRLELAWINRTSNQNTTQYFTFSALPYQIAENELIGILLIIRDVTEMGIIRQRIAQQRNELQLLQDKLTQTNLELQAANTELRQLDELKSQFVSVAAHELRTPLAALMMFSELMVSGHYGALSSEQISVIKLIENSTAQLNAVTEDLLDVTRIESGYIHLDLQPIKLELIVAMAITELKPLTLKKEQHISLSVEQDLQCSLIDRIRAQQIVRNLLGNALKYTPEKGHIDVTLKNADEPGYHLFIVKDDGIGISEEDQKHLFTRFFRASNASKTGERGTGLGLHITRSLVELHGGRIWIESEVNKGSRFYVTFIASEES